MGTKSIKKFQF